MSVFLLLVFLYRDFLTLPVSTHYPPFFNVFQFFRQKLHKIHYNIEETGFNLFQKIPEKYMPACIINWMDKYTSKRLTELKQQITRIKWQTMELEKAVENLHNRQ